MKFNINNKFDSKDTYKNLDIFTRLVWTCFHIVLLKGLEVNTTTLDLFE